MRRWTMQNPGVYFWGVDLTKAFSAGWRKATLWHVCSSLRLTETPPPHPFFSLKETQLWDFIFFFSFLQGLFYKKVPVSWGPSGTYYGSLVVINHGRVSISTQCLLRVSNSHSLTVSSTVAFLSICPLFSVAPTWTLRNWSVSCWHVCFLFFVFFSCIT